MFLLALLKKTAPCQQSVVLGGKQHWPQPAAGNSENRMQQMRLVFRRIDFEDFRCRGVERLLRCARNDILRCHCERFKARGAKRGGKNRGSWIPGLALLARNDGRVVFVIPAKAGVQGMWRGLGILFLSSRSFFLGNIPNNATNLTSPTIGKFFALHPKGFLPAVPYSPPWRSNQRAFCKKERFHG